MKRAWTWRSWSRKNRFPVSNTRKRFRAVYHILPILSDFIQLLHGSLLHSLDDVGIGVEGDSDARMAQPLRHHLGVNAFFKKPGCMGVAKVMEPARPFHKTFIQF